jgi:hypothetical protein
VHVKGYTIFYGLKPFLFGALSLGKERVAGEGLEAKIGQKRTGFEIPPSHKFELIFNSGALGDIIINNAKFESMMF